MRALDDAGMMVIDGMEVRISDAPRANEIVVALAVTDSGRPLARVGGLAVTEIKGEDGLRPETKCGGTRQRNARCNIR